MQFNKEVSLETIRKSITKELNYSFKNIYFRSYDKDDVKIKYARFWLAWKLFNERYFEDQNKYVVWMDESSINNASFKKRCYSPRGENKVLHNRKQIKNTTLVLAVSK